MWYSTACTCVYFTCADVDHCLKHLRVRLNPGLITVPVWGGYVAGVWGRGRCYTWKLCHFSLRPPPWHGVVGMYSSPVNAKGWNLAHMLHVFICSEVEEKQNIMREIQPWLRKFSFPAGREGQVFLTKKCSLVLKRYIGAALYRNPSRYKWHFNLVSLAAGPLALLNVWGVLPRAGANKSVTWRNPSPGPRSREANCGYGSGRGTCGREERSRTEGSKGQVWKRVRARERWPVSPAHSSSGQNGRLCPSLLTRQNILW